MKMRYKNSVFLTLFLVTFIMSCSNCEKLKLSQTEKDWIIHYEIGQQFYYNNKKGQIDTLVVKDTSNRFTPCNQFELSEYQYETYLVRSVFKSSNKYNGENCLITLTKNKRTYVEPEIILGGLGTVENTLNRHSVIIDTILNGVRYSSINFYKKNVNAEVYNNKEYFKNFFWDKNLGLVAYTTMRDEIFIIDRR